MKLGYMKMTVSHDTLIQNRVCKVPSRVVYSPDGTVETLQNKRIISVGDSVVYWVIGDTFYTLYDFTKKSGEVVTIPAETEFNPANGNMLYVKIDSVKTENVAGENMLVQYVSSQGMIAFSGRITEKFGHTHASFPHGNMEDDACVSFYPIRCFVSIGFYYNATNYACDSLIITSIADEPLNEQVCNIYPQSST